MNDLEECIDSILQQTYYKFEVVIVDDGSCTECAEQLEKIKEKDSRIIVFHKKNEGVSVARNYGFEHSQGEYIVYADGDDGELKTNPTSFKYEEKTVTASDTLHVKLATSGGCAIRFIKQ